jgi:hypothetical protein
LCAILSVLFVAASPVAVRLAEAAQPEDKDARPAVAAAEAWLAAFAANKVDGVMERTLLPFAFTTTFGGKAKVCEGSAESPRAMKAWISCARRRRRELIAAAKRPRSKELRLVETAEDRAALSVFGAALPKETADQRLVYAYLDAGSMSYLFTFVVVPSPIGPVVRELLVSTGAKEG